MCRWNVVSQSTHSVDVVPHSYTIDYVENLTVIYKIINYVEKKNLSFVNTIEIKIHFRKITTFTNRNYF